MPVKPEKVKVEDLATEVDALSAGQKEKLAAVIDNLKQEEAANTPLTEQEATTAYAALDDEGKLRISKMLNRQADRVARNQAP